MINGPFYTGTNYYVCDLCSKRTGRHYKLSEYRLCCDCVDIIDRECIESKNKVIDNYIKHMTKR